MMKHIKLAAFLFLGWTLICGADESCFYLRSKELYYSGPYPLRQGVEVAPVRSRSQQHDLIVINKDQPYHNLLRQEGYKRIDLHRTGAGFFELSMRYQGHLGHFMVDSGAGNQMIYQPFAQLCDMEVHLTETRIGPLPFVTVRDMESENKVPIRFVEDFWVRPPREPSLQPDEVSPNRWESFGIIGSSFLKRNKAILDYNSESLFIMPEKSSAEGVVLFKNKMAALGYHSIPLRWQNTSGHWMVTGFVGTNSADFVVDSGSTTTSADRPIAADLGLDAEGSRLRCLGEVQDADADVFRSNMHDLTVNGVPVHLRNSIWITTAGAHNQAGAEMGNDLLALHGAVLDFGEDVLYLKPLQSTLAEQQQPVETTPSSQSPTQSGF